MREIKFRLPWFKFTDNSFAYFSYWGRIDHKGESSEDCFSSPSSSSHHYHKEDQQFTGLKDKNGKEIYEGDIVTIYDPYTKSQHIDAIIWDDPNCRFAIKNTYIDFDFLIENEVVIVGNIYKNPELL
jgi:uncharacterized phage protein (TIGR01671 family)